MQALVEQGRVRVDDVIARASVRLRGGEHVEVVEPQPAPTTLVPQDVQLVVLYEDDDLLVIDKPAGLVVHPGPGHPDGTVANAVLFRCPGISIGGERRPGIVHRLDKDTSGLLVVAKNDDTQRALAASFADRRVEKRYLAYALGCPDRQQFELVTGHRRADGDRRRFTTRVLAPDKEGIVRRAHSRFVVTACADGASAIEVELLTGRTHQIRAHLADIGHALLQDELYGGGRSDKRLRPGPVRNAVLQLHRQALHAWRLAFAHPRSGQQVSFEAALPPDLALVDRAIRAGAA